jgi:hypothetical protein
MVEEKKVLLEKVDTLKNVADSLTKSVSTENFSWCRVTMGILPWIVDYIIPWTPGCKENNKWENVGYVLYSLHVCVWARQIRQLRLTIPLVVFFVSCASGDFLGGS